MPGTNEVYGEHELEDLPAELRPIPEVDWSDLSSPAVQRMVDRLPDAMLDEVPGDDRLLCGVLATGVGLHHDGAIMPTVAGLVVFGLHPELVLPGMQLQVGIDDGEPDVWSGPLPTLIRDAREHAAIGERLGEVACGLLVAHAMSWWSWREAHLHLPISMGIDGDVFALRYPGVSGSKVTNRVIVDLLCRSGWAPKRSPGLGAVKRALRGIGAKVIGVAAEGDWTVVRVQLAAAKPSRREPMERVARSVVAPTPSAPEARAPTAPRRAKKKAGALGKTGGRRSAEDRQRELVQLLAERGRMPRRVLQRRLGWSRSTLRDVLRSAVEAGKIRSLAPSPRSPFQVYQVVREPTAEHPRPPASVRGRR